MPLQTVQLNLKTKPESALEALYSSRQRTFQLIEGLSTQDLESVHSQLMSPIVWDLGHIASFEDLWLVHRFGDEQLLRPDLVDVYDAFETPRAKRGALPFLSWQECLAYADCVREQVCEITERIGVGDGYLHEMVVRHELQHGETILQTLQLSGIAVPAFHDRQLLNSNHRSGGAVPKLLEVDSGSYWIGAGDQRYSYDNERPRHQIELERFSISETAITNAQYKRFIEDGGYRRQELWSDAGWQWRQAGNVTKPLYWTDGGQQRIMGYECPLIEDSPVIHVSWFEAEAFANYHGLRLPTEQEWEVAASFNPVESVDCPYPRGSDGSDIQANLDLAQFGPVPAETYQANVSAAGCKAMIGDVWEWTSTILDGHPGFTAYPYPEYSEVFFASGYRVLKGGSWVSAAPTANITTRNWDFPQRRQIFSGFRVAADSRSNSSA